ncbi:MAG: dihydroorotate dehydrogenase-like protein [Bacteroidales bacterium]|jgi:dihydroorotate dehydrogenase (fumarate)|nr:dihydroorotate dehydrogenase-like protein [Bacteroidales bacterium]MDD4001772.1 dihydroorotate dehydrogenase-like protein [Bacteroidales bacterium]MDD4528833.1 dihydroorotate dehydrogenase-like protein [Bacteroidales bacterium]MDD4829025.1 dihydroorotate dehydrogenase-like protein [Bacteroidales bacterium]
MGISTKFMGFNIKSPIVVGSCGLTSNIETLKKIEQAGAGAVILKSLFEEQITQEMNVNIKVYSANFSGYPEAYNYIQEHTKGEAISNYINLIKEAKKNLTIPVIASINCITASEWLPFVKMVEDAGADGIELNMFILPSDISLSHEDIERLYEDIVHIIKRATSLPISLKISHYFSSLTRFAQKISWLGITNLNIFNRFYQSDINIDTLETIPVNIKSNQDELFNTIRWTAIISPEIRCNLTSGSGVHKTEDVIKLLLAGADTVQIVSVLYDEGLNFIVEANNKLQKWMEQKGFSSINQFKGKLSVKKNKDASAFHRVQFMKYYSGIE